MSVPYSRTLLGVIPWYSLLITLGAGLAILLADREARRQGLPEGLAVDLALAVIPSGIVGARIYYVVFSWADFQQDPLSVFRIWEGGLAIYGGLIAGILAVLLFCRRRRLSLLTVLDLLSPGVALAQALGRWGNYFNQEAYGPEILNPAFQFFPFGVQIAQRGTLVWHAATFFYASVLDAALFCFLLWGRRRLFRGRGEVFGCYAFCYAAGRMVLENLRADSLHLTSRVRVSQLFSLMICFCVLLMLVTRIRKEKGKASCGLWGLLPIIPGVPALLYCCGWRHAALETLPNQMALLVIFSSCALFSAWMLFRCAGWNSKSFPCQNNGKTL
ncbi:MAG: prolipoprotein diacylglyceryl transferase [Clostridia bacterium]|nr:prolipoprotein diacylglyceryl transferase [Clostridia bacterium]